MQPMGNILYIVNPAGHGGGGIKVWEEARAALSARSSPHGPIEDDDVRFTERQGHAQEIAASAKGYEVLVAVGGDGTVSEVLSGIMEHPEPRPKLAIIPAGTANDIFRNFGTGSLDEAMAALVGGRSRRADLIRIDCQVTRPGTTGGTAARGDQRRPAYRYAFSFGVVGFSVISKLKPWMKRFLGPRASYYLAMMRAIVTYKPPRMTVRWDGGEHRGRTWLVLVASVERVAAGSMCIAPGAQMDDGKLSVSVIPAKWKPTVVFKLLPKLASGKHVSAPGVSYFSTTQIEVEADRPALLEIDGDIFGTTPATFTICPGAVQILCSELND